MKELKNDLSLTTEKTEDLTAEIINQNFKGQSQDQTELFDVKNTFVDFRPMVLSAKLITLSSPGLIKTQLSQLDLSKLISSMSPNSKFFELQTVQTLIDFQFEQTKKHMVWNATIYVLFLLSLFLAKISERDLYLTAAFLLGCIVMAYFIRIEMY